MILGWLCFAPNYVVMASYPQVDERQSPWWLRYDYDPQISEAAQQVIDKYPGTSVTEIFRLLPMKTSRGKLMVALMRGVTADQTGNSGAGRRRKFFRGSDGLRWWPAGTPRWLMEVRSVQSPPLVDALLAQGPNANDGQIRAFLDFCQRRGLET